MANHIEKSASIPVSADRAFAFLVERENAPRLVPNLTRVWDITPPAAAVGQTWKWEYRMLGISMQGDARMTALEPGHKCEFKTSRAVESTWTYAVASEGSGCKATVSVDYALPDTLLAKLADKVAFHRINESQIEHVLVNLRAQVDPDMRRPRSF